MLLKKETKKRIRTTAALMVALAALLVGFGGALAADTGWQNPSQTAGTFQKEATQDFEDNDPAGGAMRPMRTTVRFKSTGDMGLISLEAKFMGLRFG